jgi:hypothetical protein
MTHNHGPDWVYESARDAAAVFRAVLSDDLDGAHLAARRARCQSCLAVQVALTGLGALNVARTGADEDTIDANLGHALERLNDILNAHGPDQRP